MLSWFDFFTKNRNLRISSYYSGILKTLRQGIEEILEACNKLKMDQITSNAFKLVL
jgi:hypothetical protein